MKRIADLYVRVSTDEQADKGYSQRDQDERLRKYCEHNDIVVRSVIYEDHSAKNFNRPEWKRMLQNYKKTKVNPDLILFTKWDRFSRNTSDAFQMIDILERLNIEVRAIEQPLDLSIPESKTILAVYLSIPEVENVRRALNTIYGMRRAMKEGRYMGVAPVGYSNKITENGKKYIAIKEIEGDLLRQAFEEIAEGIYTTEEIRRKYNRKGLKCSSAHFYHIIRNPLYYGVIYVPAFKAEQAMLVKGQHEAIITEALFKKVQVVIEARNNRPKKKNGVQIMSNPLFPLRGFLECPHCGLTLTASSSRGSKGNYYNYYHCQSECGKRYKAEVVNDLFVAELRNKYTLPINLAEITIKVIGDVYKKQGSDSSVEKGKIVKIIDEQNKRVSKARDLLLAGDLEPDDYKIIKTESETKIRTLEEELLLLNEEREDISKYLKKCSYLLTNLSEIYLNSEIEVKRKIIGSMFPQKISFDGMNYRTPKINEALSVISLINKQLSVNKKKDVVDNQQHPCQVAGSRIELPTSGL